MCSLLSCIPIKTSRPSQCFFLSTDASTYAHFLFNAFDIDRNGSIRFEDFVIGLSVLLRGSVTEKLNWAFNLYDINKDGYITKEVCLSFSNNEQSRLYLFLEHSLEGWRCCANIVKSFVMYMASHLGQDAHSHMRTKANVQSTLTPTFKKTKTIS